MLSHCGDYILSYFRWKMGIARRGLGTISVNKKINRHPNPSRRYPHLPPKNLDQFL